MNLCLPVFARLGRRAVRLLAAALASGAGVVALHGSASAQQLPGAGRVVFASGPAHIVAADGTRRTLEVGASLLAGEQVVTGADAYVHLRMVDNAFVAVRPQSRLEVELYEYDPARPAASRIKLNLHGGNTRTVSGKGGEAARQNYRFNTPVAAIGLRGTDYTVVAAQDTTRVSVARGAVAVAPLGDGCLPSALGPCATPSTRELAAGLAHAYMQVDAASRVPVLVRPEQDPQGGRRQNPAGRPEEPRASKASDLDVQAPKEVAGQMAADRAIAALPEKFDLVWGRWASSAIGPGAPTIVSLLNASPGREIVVGNDVFGLLRTANPAFSMPAQGSFNFSLGASEAYSRIGGNLIPAQVTAGNLNIDFLQRSFATTLSVLHAGGPDQLTAYGNFQFQGMMFGDPSRSNMTVNGAVASGGKEVVYLFDKPIAGGGLLGAVRWVR